MILLVDDDARDVELMEAALDRAGYVTHASKRTAEEALDFLLAQRDPANPSPQRVALILLDLSLLTESGRDFLKLVRATAELDKIPVVMFTGSRSDVDIDASYADLANAYVVKPTGAAAFSDAVVSTARFWLAHNLIPRGRAA